MTPTELLTLLTILVGALGGSGGILGILATRNQAAAQRLRDALADLDGARRDSDLARFRQHQLEDYANRLRRQLETYGITPEEWPHD